MGRAFFMRALILCTALFMILPDQSEAAAPAAGKIILLSNALSVAGGIGLFSTATMNLIDESNNSTNLEQAQKQVSATSFLSFAIGAALQIVSSEMGRPTLTNRVDELAIGMTSLGFSLLSAGIWSNNVNALLVGSVVVSSFFISRALLLPLLIERNPENFRPSDKLLLGALTVFGNLGGLLITWSSFETSEYKRQLLQAGAYILGIINPVVFTGLTINLFRSPKQDVPPIA